MENIFINFGPGLALVFNLNTLLVLTGGVVLGIVLGALPGFGSSQSLALLFPLAYGMQAADAILFALAVYSAAEYGGSIPSILIRTPGTAANAITILDGYPMAQQGKAKKALRISLYAGVVGGIISTLIFLVAGASLAWVGLKFGPGEMFAVGVFGLAIVASFLGKEPTRGFIGAGIGLLLATVGTSPFGGMRFTFDQPYLMEGLPLVVVVIGLLAGPEAIRLLVEHHRYHPDELGQRVDTSERAELNRISPEDVRYLTPSVIRGSIIGTLIGALPGAGATVGSLLAYSEEKRWSKHPERFGKGAEDGVAAPEAANNAVVAGTLVPSLALGIPGSGAAAILLGILISKGIVPGPMLYRDSGDIVMAIFIGLIVINAIQLFVGVAGSSVWSQVTRIPQRVLGPFVMLLIVLGCYAAQNYTAHVIMALLLAAMAYYFEKIAIPVVPIVLAFVMGPIIELNLNRALVINQGDVMAVLTRPLTLGILVLALITVVFAYRHRGMD